MSGRNNQKNDEGFGLGSALLVGGAAAAMGFLASEYMRNSFQPLSSGTGRSSRGPPTPPGSSGNRFFDLVNQFTEGIQGFSVEGLSSSGQEQRRSNDIGARKKTRSTVNDKDLPDAMKCVVCLVNPKEILIEPCSHACLCEDCSEKISSKCPVCQGNIVKRRPVYF